MTAVLRFRNLPRNGSKIYRCTCRQFNQGFFLATSQLLGAQCPESGAERLSDVILRPNASLLIKQSHHSRFPSPQPSIFFSTS